MVLSHEARLELKKTTLTEPLAVNLTQGSHSSQISHKSVYSQDSQQQLG